MDEGKKIDIRRDFSHELCEIQYKLQQLEDGRIYEFTGTQSDGYLRTNAEQLKEMVADLCLKIEGKRPSTGDVIASFFENW